MRSRRKPAPAVLAAAMPARASGAGTGVRARCLREGDPGHDGGGLQHHGLPHSGQGGERGEGDEPFPQQHVGPTRTDVAPDGSHVDRISRAPRWNKALALAGRLSRSAVPAARQPPSATARRRASPRWDVVPADGDEHRGRGQQKEGPRGGHPQRTGADQVGIVGFVRLDARPTGGKGFVHGPTVH